MNKAPKRLFALSLLSILGAAVSIYQSHQFYSIRSGEAGFRSFCNISATMNCDAIAASPYAELFRGIPLSSFAAGWFVALFLISMTARLSDWRRDAYRIAVAMTAFGTFLSFVYLGVMVVILHNFCLFCLIVDLVNVASLGIALSLKPKDLAKHPLMMDHAKWAAILTGGSLFVTIVLLNQLNQLQITEAQIAEMADSVLRTPVVALDTGREGELPTLGPKNAKITIVEFSDFQCPFCRLAAVTLNTVMSRYPSQIRVIFRAHPLDGSCNPAITQAFHPAACEAARVAHCAHRQGKFEAVYETLFGSQGRIAPGRVVDLAAETGADARQLAACVAEPEASAAVAKDLHEAAQLGVKSTPIFFVNGRKVEGFVPLPVWTRIVDELLRGPAS